MINNHEDPGLAWRRRAVELAKWSGDHMCNRGDCWGGYYRKDGSVHQVTRKPPEGHGMPQEVLLRHFLASGTEDVCGLHSTCWRAATCLSKWGATDIDCHD